MTDFPVTLPPKGAVAVIFVALRTIEDDSGYGLAADAMVARAATMPGYLGIDSARGGNRLGITVSYWADEASALGWKADAEHAAIRDMGRERWYAHYRLIVATVDRAYGWARQD